jgi:hypothetical protein
MDAFTVTWGAGIEGTVHLASRVYEKRAFKSLCGVSSKSPAGRTRVYEVWSNVFSQNTENCYRWVCRKCLRAAHAKQSTIKAVRVKFLRTTISGQRDEIQYRVPDEQIVKLSERGVISIDWSDQTDLPLAITRITASRKRGIPPTPRS